MTSTENSLNWFEIAADDIIRAKKFYETVFDIKMDEKETMGRKMAYFPAENMSGKANGAVVQSDMHKPNAAGARIYLNANPDLAASLSKVEAAGGKILMPKTKISDEVGHTAFFTDSEGNTVGLHSIK